MARTNCSPCAGLASASITTTPSPVAMKPAFGRPSEPRPVSENHVDAGSDLADGETLGEWREDLKQQERSQMKRMSTDCWNTPPLLSFHTNFSAASRSARKENSTNGSRLMPELQTKCAASRSPYVTLTSLMK